MFPRVGEIEQWSRMARGRAGHILQIPGSGAEDFIFMRGGVFSRSFMAWCQREFCGVMKLRDFAKKEARCRPVSGVAQRMNISALLQYRERRLAVDAARTFNAVARPHRAAGGVPGVIKMIFKGGGGVAPDLLKCLCALSGSIVPVSATRIPATEAVDEGRPRLNGSSTGVDTILSHRMSVVLK